VKKFLKISIITVIIALICLIPQLDILDFYVLDVSEEILARYTEYYFNQLELDEKKLYIRIDEAVRDKKEKVFLGIHQSEDIAKKISRILEAYFYDNPQYYYVSNEYIISTTNLKVMTFSTLELKYLIRKNDEIAINNKKLETAIDSLLSKCITETMTDFEKEVAIHDALVENTTYYQYEDIEAIPEIKHTAYGALVEKEAVCDGYSKAFKMLLEKAGIDSIIISGSTDNVLHAWNLVELDGKYYHVDVTSNKLQEESKRYVVHTYFNLNDINISKTHTTGSFFTYPKCSATEYEYYAKKGYVVKAENNLYNELQDIILKQKKGNILELRVADKFSSRNVIDTLYDLNFNNWRSNREISVSYTKMQDVYIFIKNK